MDSEDEYDNLPAWRGVPGTIILINVFENTKYNTYSLGHAATCRLIKQNLRLSTSKNIAVCVFGTEESNASLLDSKSIVELMQLSRPSLDDYKKLKNTDISSFTEAKQLIFSEALRHCSKMFSNFKKQLSFKSVIIVTPLHIPPMENDKKPTLIQVEDLVDSNIEIRLINTSPETYPPDSFFDKFYAKANKGLIIPLPKSIHDPSEIENLMQQESHRNIAVAKINFEIGKDVEIGVGLYKLVRSGQNYHKMANLHSETNTVLTSVTKTMKLNVDDEKMDTDSQENQPVPLLKSELLHYVEYGGERIEFTDAEKKYMDNPFGQSGLKLLGFKPKMVVCKEKWFTKVGYFLFPNENSIEGSTIAFKALHKACLDLSVVAICVLCPRVNAKPVQVALSPCTKTLNLDVEIGFDVIQIPFVESVRDLNINDINDNDDDCYDIKQQNKDLMKEIINQTLFDYKADMFENPKLQSEYRAIEAIALDDEEVEPFVDTTKPNSSKFENLKDDMFEELFGPFGAILKTSKRVAPNISKDHKKPKIEIDEDLLSDRIEHETVSRYTVGELRGILKSKDIKNIPALTGLKKKELVELVYKNFSNV